MQECAKRATEAEAEVPRLKQEAERLTEQLKKEEQVAYPLDITEFSQSRIRLSVVIHHACMGGLLVCRLHITPINWHSCALAETVKSAWIDNTCTAHSKLASSGSLFCRPWRG